MRLALALAAFVALVAGLGVSVPYLASGAGELYAGERPLTYNVATPRDWPIIHKTTFNGTALEPSEFRTDFWIDERSLGGGLTIAGAIPRFAETPGLVKVTSTWIEWKTGQVYRGEISAELEEQDSLYLRFQRDGALSLYARGEALKRGDLGRPATIEDYEELARICAAPLPRASNEAQKLTAARVANLGVDTARITSTSFPKPGPSFCSE